MVQIGKKKERAWKIVKWKSETKPMVESIL